MSIAPHIRSIARGLGRARALTRAEAEEAMTEVLEGRAAPEAVGALLMVLRLRGETADEITGFTAAVRTHLSTWAGIGAALDWPSYAAGRTRGLPWFLLSAKLLAKAGHPVLLHGRNGTDAALRAHLGTLGVSTAHTPEEAKRALATDGIAYAPLDALSPRLETLLALRTDLGLRSCINTLCRVANPAAAPVTLQGVFHPPYRVLQEAACAALGDSAMMVIKGGGGEFERFVGKSTACYGFLDGGDAIPPAPALDTSLHRLADLPDDPAHLPALWAGTWDHATVRATVTGTAALGLLALGAAATHAEAHAQACHFWTHRHAALAA
ncbi:MAG: glycosyl transferase family protein [Dinoroseobacter sp.]|nr:glycosyl transferase family protein [Dinoroseobacter sp.]